MARDVGTSRQGLKVRETISNHRPTPSPCALHLSSLFSCCRFFCSVLVIVYQAGQTKRAVGNWVSHLLPDMIDKSPPSAISAKLLFRRAAARFTLPFRLTPSLAALHPVPPVSLVSLILLLLILPPRAPFVERFREFLSAASSLPGYSRENPSPATSVQRLGGEPIAEVYTQ